MRNEKNGGNDYKLLSKKISYESLFKKNINILIL